jgi:hypothetical protein
MKVEAIPALPGVTEDEKLKNCVVVHALRLHHENTPE